MTQLCSTALAKAIVALSEGETLRVFGRCHNCPDAPATGRRFVLAVPRVWPGSAEFVANAPEPVRLPETGDAARFPFGWIGTGSALTNGYVPCPECGEAVWDWAGLKATLTSASCSTDCELATSEKCRCSCAGANHGARA